MWRASRPNKGRFTLVEGKVVSVRESGGTIYVNFGRRWNESFTVTISRSAMSGSFPAAGMEPRSLAGRRVMVRGWIEERGGPWIEAAAPDQIEIVADEVSGTSGRVVRVSLGTSADRHGDGARLTVAALVAAALALARLLGRPLLRPGTRA